MPRQLSRKINLSHFFHTLANYNPGTTTNTYDEAGNLYSVSNPNATSPQPTNQQYITDSQGHILQQTNTVNGTASTALFHYVNGNLIGSVNPATGQTTFDYNYQPVSDAYPPATTGQYTVQNGDTLQSISLNVYGDASLWYLIADANGLPGSTAPAVGSTLTIPNKITNLHNNSNTFRPYDASKIIGDNTPALKYVPPPPPKHHCNAAATVLIAAVVIVATIATAGAAAAAAGASVSGFGSLMSVGASAMVGGSVAAGTGTLATGLVIGSAALGGAVGSAVGQLAGNALGVTSGFSWTQVALGAIGAATGAGVGNYMQGTAVGIQASQGAGGWAGVEAGLLQGGLDSAITQGIAVGTGLQKSFSWSQVAAGAAVAGGFGAMGSYNPVNKFANVGNGVVSGTLNGFASGVARQEVAMALGGHGKLDLVNVAADAFGNAIGNSIVRQLIPKAEQPYLDQHPNFGPDQQYDLSGNTGIFSGAVGNGATSSAVPQEVQNAGDYAVQMYRYKTDELGESPQQAITDSIAMAAVPTSATSGAGASSYGTMERLYPYGSREAVANGVQVAGQRGDTVTDWSNEIQFVGDLGRNAFTLGRGALSALESAVYEPLAMAADTTRILGAGVYSLLSGTSMPTDIELYSSLGTSGMSTADAFGAMVTGIVTAPYRIGFDGTTAILNGDPEHFGASLGEGAMMLLGGRRAIAEIAPEAGATLGASFYRMSGRIEHPAGADFALPAKESPNFASAQPIVLEEGSTIYRVVGGTTRDNGGYWSLTPPPVTESAWRSGNAVVEGWGNPGTHYVEFTVPAGGLPAWSGAAASQGLGSSANALGWIQPGGVNQIFIPNARAVIPPNLTRMPTPWSAP